MKNFVKSLLSVLLGCLLCFGAFLTAGFMRTVYASETGELQTAYEKQNVSDDLKEMTFNGEPFSLDDYPQTSQGAPTVLSFVEFCFPYYATDLSDFGLYLLVYDPQQIPIQNDETRNTLQMSVGSSSAEHKYSLRIVNYSTEQGSEHRFYKMKVVLTALETRDIVKSLGAEKREYRLSDLELMMNGELVHSLQGVGDKKGMKVTYSGYAEGFGSEEDTPPLTCSVDGLEHLVSVDLHHTYYRAGGDFVNGEQSQINSVFFRIPNKYLNDYGDLTAVLCEWYEYFTKPFLVTNDADVARYFDTVCKIPRSFGELGRYGGKLVAGRYKVSDLNAGSWFVSHKTVSDYFLNAPFDDYFRTGVLNTDVDKSAFSYLSFFGTKGGYRPGATNEIAYAETDGFAGAFYSGAAEIVNPDNYISSYRLKQEMLENSFHPDQCGYDPDLFENYVYPGNTLGRNSKTIVPDLDFTLDFNTIEARKWWQKVFTGGYDVSSKTEHLKAFEVVDEDDLNGTPTEIAVRLFIDKFDVNLLREEVLKAEQNDETVYLMRFGSSSYFCFPGVVKIMDFPEPGYGDSMISEINSDYDDEKWNCFLFQETVYLNFDVLSFTFSRYGVDTVIPVSAVPQDVINAGTPPLESGFDKTSGCLGGLGRTLTIVVAVVALVVLLILFPPILKGVVWLIALPFKGIAALCKAIGKQIRRRREERATAKKEKEKKKKPQ